MPIASVSLGATRTFEVRRPRKGDDDKPHTPEKLELSDR
jgi:alkylated DNA repair dioxygenase AlkB